MARLPPGELSMRDLLSSADAAIVAGDAHRAPRLIAEALARCATQANPSTFANECVKARPDVGTVFVLCV